MNDLIDRQNAIDVFELLADKMSDEGKTVMAQAVAVLKDLQSAESERTAKVETYTDGQEELWSICECETDVRKGYNYCPKCGAKLKWSE